MEPHISLAAEQVGSIFGLPITNSLIMTWLVMILLSVFAWVSTRKLKLVPDNIQSFAEVIHEILYSLFKSVVGAHKINKLYPLLATIFLFVIIGNWAGLLPGVGSIGYYHDNQEHALIKSVHAAQVRAEVATTDSVEAAEHKGGFTPLFRGPTADLNTTLAIAIFAVGALQCYGFQSLGLGYLKKYLNFENPIMFFVGILEIISELAKIVSFAFRLFGNIFAGEVLLAVIAFLMPLIAPLPFLGLELFVGFIQALVFSMLTAVFLNMAVMAHEH